jgi:hypothetical protein
MISIISLFKGKYFKTFTFVLFVSLFSTFLSACGPNIRPKEQVKFWPKPTEAEAREKIDEFLENNLIDPYSAVVKCGEPSSEAWVWTGVGFPAQYGYLVRCSVNAKNRFGGYVGAKQYRFLFNGPNFDYIEHMPRMGTFDGTYEEAFGRPKK